MNIWIIRSGVRIVFRSFLDLPVKEDLISGLLTAINQFVMSEFNHPIDSIDMGGLLWVYDFSQENNLLFVIADEKSMNLETVKSRLEFIKMLFLKEFVIDNPKWKDFDGSLDQFKDFSDRIESYYNNWQAAENIDDFAQLFDTIRIFQEVFNILKQVIDSQLDPNRKKNMTQEIDDYMKEFKGHMDIMKVTEMQKISYSPDLGFNIFEINPSNCDINFCKKQIKTLFVKTVNIIKDNLGHDLTLNYFSETELFNYIFRNSDLLRKLGLADFFLQLFLIR